MTKKTLMSAVVKHLNINEEHRNNDLHCHPMKPVTVAGDNWILFERVQTRTQAVTGALTAAVRPNSQSEQVMSEMGGVPKRIQIVCDVRCNWMETVSIALWRRVHTPLTNPSILIKHTRTHSHPPTTHTHTSTPTPRPPAVWQCEE